MIFRLFGLLLIWFQKLGSGQTATRPILTWFVSCLNSGWTELYETHNPRTWKFSGQQFLGYSVMFKIDTQCFLAKTASVHTMRSMKLYSSRWDTLRKKDYKDGILPRIMDWNLNFVETDSSSWIVTVEQSMCFTCHQN